MHDYKEVIALLTEKGTDKEVWDYITALRGPDSGNDGLKAFFTTMIRGIAMNNTLGVEHYGKIHLTDMREFKNHFGWHTRSGLKSVAKYYRILGNQAIPVSISDKYHRIAMKYERLNSLSDVIQDEVYYGGQIDSNTRLQNKIDEYDEIVQELIKEA